MERTDEARIDVALPVGMQKTLSLWNYFTIGFGAIIGTGWALSVGDWMVTGGGPVAAMVGFLLGAILLLPLGSVFGELAAAIPLSGGVVEYVDRTFGSVASRFTGWLLALVNAIPCPWEAIAVATLLSEVFATVPGLELAAQRQALHHPGRRRVPVPDSAPPSRRP